MQEILDGQDTHSNNEAHFNLPSRSIAKIYLFRTIYRGSGWSFANDRDFNHVSDNVAYWEDINEQFYEKYYGLDAKHKKWAKLVAERKPILGPTGRQWQIAMRRDRRGEPKMPWTTLSNYPVQGTGHDIMMCIRIEVARKMREQRLKSLLVCTVHDSIVADCPDDEVNAVAKIMFEVFMELPAFFRNAFNVNMNIPLTGEVSIGHNMKEMKEIFYEDVK